MNALLKKLFETYPVIPLDGAWGTELTNRGLPAGETPEKWNLDFPEKVAKIPKAYADAGAKIYIKNL
jgi:5-methyltetrahydrofolate--homocysteine methyltransferase